MKAWMFLISFGFIVTTAFGQSENKADGVRFWDSNIVKINYGFGGLSLGYQGQVYSVYWGLDSDLVTLLEEDPQVKTLIESYQRKSEFATGMLWGGLTSTVGGIWLAAANAPNASSAWGSVAIGSGIVLALTGFVSVLLSPAFYVASYDDLTNGVNLYNRDQMKTLK